MAKVKVKLAARCLVDGAKREKGEVVEIDEEIAQYFGTVEKPEAKADAKESKPEKK